MYIHEFSFVVVIENDVSADYGLDGIFRSAGDGRDGGIIEGQHRHRSPAVDLAGEVGFGNVLIEGTQIRVLPKQSGHIVGVNSRREQSEQED